MIEQPMLPYAPSRRKATKRTSRTFEREEVLLDPCTLTDPWFAEIQAESVADIVRRGRVCTINCGMLTHRYDHEGCDISPFVSKLLALLDVESLRTRVRWESRLPWLRSRMLAAARSGPPSSRREVTPSGEA